LWEDMEEVYSLMHKNYTEGTSDFSHVKEKLEEVRTALSDVQQDGKHSAFNTDTIIELLEHTQDRLDFGTAEISSLKDEMGILQNYIGIMSEWMNNAFYVINQTIKNNHDDMKNLVERFFKNYNREYMENVRMSLKKRDSPDEEEGRRKKSCYR